MNRPRFVRGHLIRIDLGRESIAASLEVRHDLLMRAVAGSVAAVAAASALVYALQPIAPTLSLGALYTLAVLAVAVLFGAAYGVVVAVASMVAFNFFFLRPVHTLTLADARNWTALAVYLAVAIVASQLATRARNRAALAEQREREASFLADIAAEILQTGSVEDLPARAAGVVDSADRVARERLQAALDTLLGMSRSDAIKTTILQAVSHDFRTPLATMAAAVDGLESGDLTLSDADRAELLETVRLELARLTRLVENLLDLSRIQAGAVAPRLELWSVDDLVSDLARSERVRVDLPGDLPPVCVDAVQLQRAVANLVDNALKYSAGEVEVQARRDDGRVLLEVLDRGGGATPAGMGLGLAIARGFATANGCEVTVEPRVGGGTRAVLSVPA
jgi:two-component system, OmpR family, sensor histidine kinase KdpD